MSIEVLLVLACFVGLGTAASWAFTRPFVQPDAGQAALLSPAVGHGRKRAAIALVGAAALACVLLFAGPWLAHAVAAKVGPSGPTGLSLALTPLVIGIAYAGVYLAAERTWPRPVTPVREATLRPRSYARFAPRWLAAIVGAWAVGLVATLTWSGVVGNGNQLVVFSYSNDPLRVPGEDAGFGWMAASPFPGWSYGIPTLILGAILVALAWLTLREVQRRPAVPGLDGTLDDDLRRGSARQVLGVTQAALGVTLAGNLYVISSALQSILYQAWAIAVLVLAVAVTVTSLVALGIAVRRR